MAVKGGSEEQLGPLPITGQPLARRSLADTKAAASLASSFFFSV
jgi:hypothetical protein